MDSISFKAFHSFETFSSMVEFLEFPKDKWDTDYLY